jgi:hypothetical protein
MSSRVQYGLGLILLLVALVLAAGGADAVGATTMLTPRLS